VEGISSFVIAGEPGREKKEGYPFQGILMRVD